MTRRPRRSRLLFVFGSAGGYRLQRSLVQRAVAAGHPLAFLYIRGRDSLFEEAAHEADRHGVEVISLDDATNQVEAPSHRDNLPSFCWRSLAAAVALSKLQAANRARLFRTTFARRKTAVRQLLRRLGVGAVICSEDSISADLTVIAVAHSMRVPVIDVPYGNGTRHEIEVDLAAKGERGEMLVATGGDLRWLKRFAPQWLNDGRYANAVMYPPDMILAMESLGITVRDPWIIHGGMSDVLCVENQVGLRQYRRESIPEAKLRLTGSPYCDVMVDALKAVPDAAAALRQPRRIEDGVTRILVSWPPSYHETYPGRNEFPSFEEMTRAVFAFLKSLSDTRLTVSLHPACSDQTRGVLDGLGIAVSDEYVIELIPRHDVFVTYFSSTIRWALAAGKPVVNYDAYGLGLTTYDEAPGFVNAVDFAGFRDRMSELTSSAEAFADLAGKQIADADDWGILDGRCSERIFAEVDRLT